MKIGRNDPCPCGSGKKYKFCCINQMSSNEIEQLYLKQFDLTHELSDEAACNEIISIGNRIISNTKHHVCLTGTYVNMALAKRILYFITQNTSNLTMSKNYCLKALEIKPTNQVAIRTIFGIYLDLHDYQDASLILDQHIDRNLFSPMSQQIIVEYQNSIETANRSDYSSEVKAGLDTITDKLFEKFGMNAGLCAVAVSYYLGVGNDTLRAYELGRRSIEEYPCPETYNSLGWICLNPEINRQSDAAEYFLKALELSNNAKEKTQIEGNYFIALLENNHFLEAEHLITRLVVENPCNQNFSNYSELLKRQGKSDDALEWGRKALFLIEDDTTLLIVADIYRKKKQYNNAIVMYKKCFSHIDSDKNVYKFDDISQKQLCSFASSNNLDMILFEALKGIISSLNSIRDYENARIYLEIAKEKLPDRSEWTIWEDSLSEINYTTQQYEQIKAELAESNTKIDKQKEFVRQWALELIQLQDNSIQLNLDSSTDWSQYEIEMDKIIDKMSNLINKNSIAYQHFSNWVNATYPSLDIDAKNFLITAETLFDMHMSSVIDFSPIIVEYSKVIEKQLRTKLSSHIPNNIHMLGQLIHEIQVQHLAPYNQYLSNLKSVNDLRRRSAHTGVLNRTDVDTIRNIFFTQNLIANLI